MRFIYNDGGREAAGYKGKAGDCATRAIAIATGLPYREVYDALNELAKKEKTGKRKKTVSNSRKGVHRASFQSYLESLGWKWVPCMKIGTGCKVHLKEDELPDGTIIVSLSRHYACVKGGAIYDTYDCSRDGKRCVYGYYIKEKVESARSEQEFLEEAKDYIELFRHVVKNLPTKDWTKEYLKRNENTEIILKAAENLDLNEEIYDEIKKRAEQFARDNYKTPTVKDVLMIESAMLIGASIKLEMEKVV